MSKVKIVQIAVALSEQESVTEYLDDKGRVWYDGGHSEIYYEKNKYADPNKKKSRWVTEWKQIDLPEEPDESL